MSERGFRPWVVTLVLCVGVALVLTIWVNASGGFADPPWFLTVGIGTGATLACLWLVARALVGWRWVQEDAPPGEEGLAVEESVGAYQGTLANPDGLTRSVVPMLRTAVSDRLQHLHAVDLDDPDDAARVDHLVPARLLAVVRDEQPLTRKDLPGVLDDLDTLGAPEPGPTDPDPQDPTLTE